MKISETTKIYGKSLTWPLITFIFLFLLSSCNLGSEKVYKESRIAMYTVTTITITSHSEKKAADAINKAFQELDRLEKILNYYSKDSEITMINKNAGNKPVKVSKETIEIIGDAIYVAENTNGVFDITMGPVISLWDFKKKVFPDAKKLGEKLKLVGYKNIVIDKKNSTAYLKQKGMEVNLGGIIKGYAADKAAAVLQNNGIKAGIVSVAGDIKTFGTKPDGTPWNVGIQNPRSTGKTDEILAVANLSGQAISTAGDYERYFIKDGIRYHHILSTKTGYPVSECQSATVITEKGVYADGFDTAIFILGPEKGMAVLKKLGFEGIIIDRKGNRLVTEGIRKNIDFTQK